ncbi:pilus assembly protein CpaE [Dermabacteraceae bacterium TAE3-ERU27]|nr:pilus assembly protein CpaE [Dermabacteraceae bacterium TAE3-ERU27]
MIALLICVSGSDEVRIVHDLATRYSDRVSVTRRCADLAETIACAHAGPVDAVLLDLETRGLDRGTVSDLQAAGVTVVGLGNANEPPYGLRYLLKREATGEEIVALLETACADGEAREEAAASEPVGGDGKLLAVWGPEGGPGRSFFAANLAYETHLQRVDTLLVDADTRAPCLAQLAGVVEENAALLTACRLAARDCLGGPELTGLSERLGEHLRLLPGIGLGSHWSEIREAAYEQVLECLRACASLSVLDIAAGIADEADDYDPLAPQRNAVTRQTLAAADTVFAVVDAHPVSLTRLIRETELLAELGVGNLHVVVNRLQPPLTPAQAEAMVRERIECRAVHALPVDVQTARRCAWDGAFLAEAAPRSALRERIREIASAAVAAQSGVGADAQENAAVVQNETEGRGGRRRRRS